jgi:hypothetical protein
MRTPFDWVKDITVNKPEWSSFTEDEQASFTPFMIHRVLSMTPEYIDFVNLVQKLPQDNKEKIYRLYVYMIPKKSMFNKYIKTTKKKKQEALLRHVASYYECSLGEAEEYVDILRESGVKSILTKMGVEEKDIKKLLKNG